MLHIESCIFTYYEFHFDWCTFQFNYKFRTRSYVNIHFKLIRDPHVSLALITVQETKLESSRLRRVFSYYSVSFRIIRS